MAKESIKNLEKQVTDEGSKDALPPVQVMAGGEEQDPLILLDGRINPRSIAQHYHLRKRLKAAAEFAAKMNLGLKNWRLPYWLIAGSVIVITNHIHAAPKLIPPELPIFALFICGTGLVFLAMKKMV